MARFAGLHHLLVGAVGALWLASPGAAQTEDNSRAVRIIEDPPAGAAPTTPPLRRGTFKQLEAPYWFGVSGNVCGNMP